MTTVLHEQDLDISASAAWDVLYDFGGFLNWGTGGQGTIELEGEGVGMIRKMDIPGAGHIEEKLVRREPESRTLSYQLVGGQPIGMAEYLCVVRLIENGDGSCHIDWHGEFTAADDQDEAEVADSLKGSYVGMSKNIAKYAKAQ